MCGSSSATMPCAPIARQAMARKVGARGLRMILEELMLDLMYHLPSQKRVKEFEVTRRNGRKARCFTGYDGKGRIDRGLRLSCLV